MGKIQDFVKKKRRGGGGGGGRFQKRVIACFCMQDSSMVMIIYFLFHSGSSDLTVNPYAAFKCDHCHVLV